MDKQREKVRTRYAPSPTGFFHIGGARTALFNYLFAKHFKGDFIVRIEDTDIEREVQGGIDSQLDNLKWLGIHIDESIKNPGEYGPYIQTQKLKRYQDLANELVIQGKAYYCFCSAKDLETQRNEALKNGLTPKYNRCCLKLSKEEILKKINENVPYTIRLKMPDNTTVEWEDVVRGKISIPTSALTDPVILKSNKIPMYNFAVVVDDYDMKITHILRGEEHISNTPYQIVIKKALGFDSQEIKYGHLSIIVDESGKKLSKRNLELKQFIEDYKKLGYLPEAIINFLALLGWTSSNNKEIMDISELIANFDPTRISKAPAFFDVKKMQWISNQYFKKMSDDDYVKFVTPFVNLNFEQYQIDSRSLLLMFKNQLEFASQINHLITDAFDLKVPNFNDPTIKEIIEMPHFFKIVKLLKSGISAIEKISFNDASSIIETIKQSLGLKGKELFMPIRLITSLKIHGPELNKTMSVIGKKRILDNIDKYFSKVE